MAVGHYGVLQASDITGSYRRLVSIVIAYNTLVNVYVALPALSLFPVVHTLILWNKMAAPMI